MNERAPNFLSGSPLNRLSWLRTSAPFLNALVLLPSTRWVAFLSGAPLTAYDRASSSSRLVALPTTAVQSLLGPTPIFGQGKNPGEEAEAGVSILDSARFAGAPLVFLGVHESSTNELPVGGDPVTTAQALKGTPYFSIDVSDAEQDVLDGLLKNAETLYEGAKVSFAEARASTRGMSRFDAGVFAEARSMVDWNGRNKFCPACGSPQFSLWAGWKLACSSLLPWADNGDRKPCPTAKGLHNIAHPRTDGVVIMAVVNEANDRILLGHNKKFPGNFYSTLAGFIEPGESFEDAVKREILEEAGIHVWNVRYHSAQPWPYPANLMVGFFATGDPSEPIRLDLDNELADARWYTREEIHAVLAHPDGTNITRRDHQRMANAIDQQPNVGTAQEKADAPLGGDAAQVQATQVAAAQEVTKVDVKEGEPLIRVPPETAIAGVLISDWAYGRFPPLWQTKGHL